MTRQTKATFGMVAIIIAGAWVIGFGLATNPTYGGGFGSKEACAAAAGYSSSRCDIRDDGSLALDGGEAAAMAAMVLAAVGVIWYYNLTPDGPAKWTARKARRAQTRAMKAQANRPLSEIGVRGPAGLACPKCSGTQFTVGRPTAGIYGATGRRTKVSCVTCGTVYNRG